MRRVGDKQSMQAVKSKNGRSDDTLTKNGKNIALDKIYRPTEREPFMNERQREISA